MEIKGDMATVRMTNILKVLLTKIWATRLIGYIVWGLEVYG